jgi:hypothetical protein
MGRQPPSTAVTLDPDDPTRVVPAPEGRDDASGPRTCWLDRLTVAELSNMDEFDKTMVVDELAFARRKARDLEQQPSQRESYVAGFSDGRATAAVNADAFAGAVADRLEERLAERLAEQPGKPGIDTRPLEGRAVAAVVTAALRIEEDGPGANPGSEAVPKKGAHRDYYDQYTSPLTKRRYLTLARQRAFPVSKVGKQVLVLRADLDTYIANQQVHLVPRGRPEPPDETDAILGRVGLRRVKP